MLTIGQFSRVSLVTIKTLRYYDDIGLFVPARVDSATGYRYYDLNQLPRLHRILALRDLGLSLDQIVRTLDSRISTEELRGMLRLKQAELEQRVSTEQARLAAVAVRLAQIEREGQMASYDIVIKDVPATLVASRRAIIPDYTQISTLYADLFPYLARFGENGVCGAIWHDDEQKDADVDAEAFIGISKRIPDSELVKVHDLPAAKVASVVHHGPYVTLTDAWAALYEWISQHGRPPVDKGRELYLQVPAEGGIQDDPNCVTELQVPIG